jgi:hypothetical protein
MEQPFFDYNPNFDATVISPEKVRGLSLGKITERFGTLGLYVRTIDSLQQNGFGDNELVQSSLYLGCALHFNDTRTNGHYTDHLMRVTLHMLDDFHIKDPNLIASGPLHDAFEDHPFDLATTLTGERAPDVQTARKRGRAALASLTNQTVVDIIASVTNPEPQPGEDKQTSYNKHVNNLVLHNPQARVLKLADFIDNAAGNHATIGALQHKLDLKYIDQYRTHMMGLYLPDSLITGKDRQEALHVLSIGHARALARLAIHKQNAQSAK